METKQKPAFKSIIWILYEIVYVRVEVKWMVQLVPGARQKAEPVYSYGKTANVQVAELKVPVLT
jgi:hypothetical protein